MMNASDVTSIVANLCIKLVYIITIHIEYEIQRIQSFLMARSAIKMELTHSHENSHNASCMLLCSSKSFIGNCVMNFSTHPKWATECGVIFKISLPCLNSAAPVLQWHMKKPSPTSVATISSCMVFDAMLLFLKCWITALSSSLSIFIKITEPCLVDMLPITIYKEYWLNGKLLAACLYTAVNK